MDGHCETANVILHFQQQDRPPSVFERLGRRSAAVATAEDYAIDRSKLFYMQ